MSFITTHILDTSLGKPAAGVKLILKKEDGGNFKTISEKKTNDDGRVPDLVPADFTPVAGNYAIEFLIADYFTSRNQKSFYPTVEIQFIVEDASEHFHVPLLLNPYGYSTYRGS